MFSETLILCPTAAGAREARRRELDRHGKKAALGVTALSKHEFVRDVFSWLYPDTLLLNSSERTALAARVARECAARPGDFGFAAIARHPGFWKNALSFIDECREGLMPPDRLHDLMLEAQLPRGRAENLKQLYRGYLKALEESGAADRVAAEEKLLADLPGRWSEVPFLSGLSAMVIEGMVDIRPLFFELILALSRGVGIQVRLPIPPAQRRANRWLTELYERFESLGDDPDRSREPAKLDCHLSVEWDDRRPLKPLLDRLFLSPVSLQEEARSRKQPFKWLTTALPLKILKTSDVREEWKSAARRVRTLLDEGAPPESIAILGQGIRSADEFQKTFKNFGIPLDLAEEDESSDARESVRRILSIYSLIETDFAREDLLAFVERPTWDLPATLGDPDLGMDLRQARVLQNLKDIPVQLESQAKFIEARNPVQARRLKRLARDIPRAFEDISKLNVSRPAAGHLDALFDLLEKNSFLMEAETGRWLEERRANLRRIFDGWTASMPCDEFAQLLECSLGDRPSPRRPGGGVAVLRLEDMPSISVDHLFVLDMNAGVFPREPLQEVILKDSERSRLNRAAREKNQGPVRFDPLLTAERERLRENFMFFLSLFSVRKSATLACPARDLGGRTRAPSVYLDDILLHVKPEDRERMFLAPPGQPMDPAEQEAEAVAAAFEPGGGRGGVAVPDPARFQTLLERADIERRRLAFFRQRGLENRARFSFEHTGRVGMPVRFDRSLSITGLEEFARCMFRGFSKHVLHVLEAERPKETISAMDIGSLIHAAVFEWWRGILAKHPDRPEKNAGAVLEDAKSILPDILRESARKYLARGAEGPLWAAQARLIGRVIESLVELDIRQAEAGYWPVSLEEIFSLYLPDSLGPARGRLDRLDRSVDGLYRVIDYKTSDAKFLQGKKPKQGISEIQMPAYAMAVRQKFGPETPVELFYYSLRHQAEAVDILKGRKKTEMSMVLLPQLLEKFEGRLQELIRAFDGGHCDVTPSDPDACSTCMCRTSCRILPGVALDQDAADEDEEESAT